MFAAACSGRTALGAIVIRVSSIRPDQEGIRKALLLVVVLTGG